ncbi:DUF7715 family protein [Microterricola viridarii]|uniref:DUF7715 domain-containing protein n=1 Tax=Microterricola viridarii TaxID=412690 RepID=A0A0X8E4C9_9MICO|nr:hypothetical protein [Microterricola viridarii]AMB59173.1 hypothetical protein AWU67_10215 [Microterricola viridarii]
MKVLVATGRKQGARPSDIMDGIEGELVYLVDPCPTSRRFPYGPCDCGITFRGCFSEGVTTTAMVRDIDDVTLADYAAALDTTHNARVNGGCTCGFDARAHARRLLAIAAPLRDGIVVERCVDRVRVRR